MKSILSAICCVGLCSVPALAQKTHGKGVDKGAAMTDQEFVDFAAQTDMMEAHLGQLASDQAAQQGVKDYAQMLVKDHTADYKQLTLVAAKGSLHAPNGLDAAHDKMIAPFEKLKGVGFDHHYIQEMIAGHTKAIAVYKREAADAQSTDLKAYASQTLPTLENHLQGSQDLAKPHKK